MLTEYIDSTACVYGIYGALGGGKTLTAVEICLWAKSHGFSLVSNIRLNIDYEKYIFVEDTNAIDWWSLPCGAPRGSSSPFRSCIVIDECAEFFDQFSSTSSILKNFLSWLRHSSKRGQYVFLIVQQPEFIAKSLRLLINKWIVCVDMDSFRLPFFRCKFPFASGFVWRRVFDRWGNLISRGWNFANKKKFGRFYNTAQMISVSGHDSNFSIPDVVSIPLIKRVFYFCVLLWLLTVIFIH